MYCRICHARLHGDYFVAREMMYGTLDEFTYIRCKACRSIQIADIPTNLAQYYPTDYYSLRARRPGFRQILRLHAQQKVRRYVSIFPLWMRLKRLYKPSPSWIAVVDVEKGQLVLDVGTGSGEGLFQLCREGYNNLVGVDPYTPASFRVPSLGIEVRKCTLEDAPSECGLIMFHHSLEHMENPMATLKVARKKLAQCGKILVRVPLANSEAESKYETNWVQLDAPRHLNIPSLLGFELMAASAGLRICKVFFDSTSNQYWCSELYRRGIPMSKFASDEPHRSFTECQLASFEQRTRLVNQNGEADQAVFLLEADPPLVDETA